MDQDKLAELLLATFLEEMQEHVGNINRELLSLEKNPSGDERDELFKILFRSAHTLKGSSRAVNAAPIEAACHEFEEVLTGIRDARIEVTPDLFALLFDTADGIEEAGLWLRDAKDLSNVPLLALVPRLQQAAEGTAPGGGQSTPSQSPSPTQAQPQALTNVDPARASPAAATVRVAADKLDALLAKSGELLIARRRVASRAEDVTQLRDQVTKWKNDWRVVDKLLRQHKLADTEHDDHQQVRLPRGAANVLTGSSHRLRQLEKNLDRLVSTIQADGRHLDSTCDALDQEVHQARMLPFAEACRGLERAARDVARKSGKRIELSIEGEDVELDRSVLEGLKDPLLHLVRNAVDHGIESTDERTSAGKASNGSVTISAALSGTEVEVVVADDGGGVDLERVREKVIQRGLPEPRDDAGLLRMLFHPSFSTAAIVTDVSGRGVGLDVVQSTVESLHGTVQVVSPERGRGTRFVIRVPLTLTKIRAVLVVAGGQTYAIATSSVEKLVRFSTDELCSMGGREALLCDAAPLPISSLVDALALRPDETTKPPDSKRLAIVLSNGGERAALAIDEVRSEQEVVVQNLGSRIRRVRHVAGASLLPSGRIALVLNVPNVIQAALGSAQASGLRANTLSTTASVHRLLVVDDSLTTRTLMKSILETAGYIVDLAVDGDDAWRQIQHTKPALVVSDVDMPGMDGFELTSAIRKTPQSTSLPVILVTARQKDADQTRGINVGADAYIVKSTFDQNNLLETITQLL